MIVTKRLQLAKHYCWMAHSCLLNNALLTTMIRRKKAEKVTKMDSKPTSYFGGTDFDFQPSSHLIDSVFS
jgi:hypothetical protein